MSEGTKQISVLSMIRQRYRAIAKGAATRSVFYALLGGLIFILLLVLNLVAYSLKALQGSTLDLSRTALQVLTLFFFSRALDPLIFRYRDLSRLVGKPEASTIPVKALRWFVGALLIGELFSFLPELFSLKLNAAFEATVPNTVVSINFIGIVWLTGFAAIMVGFAKLLFLWQKTAEVRRKLLTWFVPVGGFGLFEYLRDRGVLVGDTSSDLLLYGLRFLVIFSTLFLWFRVDWIPHVSRKDKNMLLVLSALAAIFSGALFVSYSLGPTGRLLENYTIMLHGVILVSMLGMSAYFGLIFFTALFSLSSTELVERRAAEVQSLAKLTRFSSDVLTSELLLDIPKLADQITVLAREATKSDCAWLILNFKPVFGSATSETRIIRSFSNITPELMEVVLRSSRQQPRSGGAPISLAYELENYSTPVLITNGDLLAEAPNEFGFSHGKLSSLIAIPLLHREEFRGAIYVAKEQEYGYDDEDVTVLTAFSDIASLALDTARLLADSVEKQKFDGELRAARSMQQSLLPSRVPEIPGYEISAISIPAYEVGGDYYDFTVLWDGSPMVVIGDVSGKGISASIFMAEIKGIVQALAPMMMNLGELFIGTNDALMRNITEQGFRRSFVTLSAIGFKDNVLTYARAGHTPLLIFAANGEYQYLQPKGMGVGFVGKNIFDGVLEQKQIMLEAGEVLILFSDGITEVRNDEGEELGYIRFAEIVRAARFEDTVGKMTDRILRQVLLFAGDAQFIDDATFVIIRKS